ncbi:MAG: GDP-mannose 4,6-dehydratase [Candidatus Taylorbacteria bacterium CG11_big_fil_rev_8_21_14_0_20_46_11]|uniref:GDP-mannose 4,6-dehydratase n=1 Tax=Candidatus Taylorbacteria bacterium CG11_big_fil_rev_8_21_14_0_20_46_11 TaxID=1975025 RepID=A0A2H0KB80_9BACT|nr:MAG: GDP-mannose 4,6-dehydratase [Candidatus Taylorbacteria bacterium CG11_big_fil_rev_8_21_14_0_20_46_11]
MIGSAFTEHARAQGLDVFGVARSSAASRLVLSPDPTLMYADILDPDAIADVIDRVHPDIVAHFAAQAFNGPSWSMEHLTHETNYRGTWNVLRACKKSVPNAKILLACSSAEYGIVPDTEQPITEHRLLCPLTPYGVSKVGTETLGYQFFINYGMQVFLPRLFIHVGTGHPPATMIQNFARQIALVKKGKMEPTIHVGALDTRRDFIDVRDGVKAMFTLLEKGTAGEPVNVCTNTAYSGKQILEMLMKIAGVQVTYIESAAFRRPSDETLLLGDNTILCNLGWAPEYTIEQTLEAVYQDWLNRV